MLRVGANIERPFTERDTNGEQCFPKKGLVAGSLEKDDYGAAQSTQSSHRHWEHCKHHANGQPERLSIGA
jgi:hypothetical protein